MARTYFEFFCGGGMVRAGLGDSWTCLFANDIDRKKAFSYAVNWGRDEICVADVAELTTAQLPRSGDLAWASFPCQDLSLAGSGAGLMGRRSGTFWPFWNLIRALKQEGRAPRLVVLENVVGALSSHGGKDFAAIGEALTSSGYRFGAVVMNAAHFVPQSRPRLFIIGVLDSVRISRSLVGDGPECPWHSASLIKSHGKLPTRSRSAWLWWRMQMPPSRESVLADLLEHDLGNLRWNTPTETNRLLKMMSRQNRAKVTAAENEDRRVVGTVYKRTRLNTLTGAKVQRAEVRFDDVAGCLRTPAGGSSRQTIMIVEGKRIRTRLLSSREAARLMGLSDNYILPTNYNESYHLAGDGVAVPVVRFLSENVLEPLLAPAATNKKKAA